MTIEDNNLLTSKPIKCNYLVKEYLNSKIMQPSQIKMKFNNSVKSLFVKNLYDQDENWQSEGARYNFEIVLIYMY